MPRVAGRPIELVKQLVEEAAWEEIAHVMAEDLVVPVVPVEMRAVLERANKQLEGLGLTRVTTGFINASFDGKQAFFDHVLDVKISPQTGDAQSIVESAIRSLHSGVSPSTVRRNVVSADLGAILNDLTWTRVWWAHHAQAARSQVRARLERVYDAFDALYLALYEVELAARGRRMRAPLSLPDLARAQTALIEGHALRLLSTAGPWSEAQLVGASAASEALFTGMTEPLGAPTAPDARP